MTIDPAGVTIVTIDVDEDRAPDVVMSVERLSSAPMGTFDAVFALEVLEHVQELNESVAGMKSVLVRGGHLILSVPWIAPLHDLPHDYRRLTPKALLGLLEGYDIELFEGHGTGIQSIRYLALRGVYSRSRADRVVAFGLAMAPRPGRLADLYFRKGRAPLILMPAIIGRGLLYVASGCTKSLRSVGCEESRWRGSFPTLEVLRTQRCESCTTCRLASQRCLSRSRLRGTRRGSAVRRARSRSPKAQYDLRGQSRVHELGVSVRCRI